MEGNRNAAVVLDGDATALEAVDVLLVVAVTVAIAYASFRFWDMHPLYGRNKGPKVYPIVGSTVPFLLNRHRFLDYHTELLQNAARNAIYTIRGVRPVNRCSYITTDPANIEYILRTNFTNFPKGEFINKHLRSIVGDGIFNADDYPWIVQRKVASPEFTTRSLRDFWLETTRAATNENLLPTLSAAAESDSILNLQDTISRFLFDNICRQGFGVRPGCLSSSLSIVTFAEAFDTATRIIFKRSQSFSHSLWTLKEALDMGDAKKLRLALSVIDEFVLGVLENRRNELQLQAFADHDHKADLESNAASRTASGNIEEIARRLRDGSCKNDSDLLSRFTTMINVLHDEKKYGTNKLISISSSRSSRGGAGGGAVMSKSPSIFIRDMVISFILAGKDTSTASLSWFFWLLATHPDVESAILKEISAVLSRRPSDSKDEGDPQICNSGSDFSFQELKEMHYLTAALMESMRLYPPVPLNFKTVRGSDVLPDGTKLEAGSIVGYHAFAMGRMEHLWGQDCLSFRPKRWLNNQGAFVPTSPFKFPIFHAGPRMCLGKDVAMMQMKAICVAVVKNFKFEISSDFRPEYLLTLTLRLKHGLPMKIRRRIIRTGSGANS